MSPDQVDIRQSFAESMPQYLRAVLFITFVGSIATGLIAAMHAGLVSLAVYFIAVKLIGFGLIVSRARLKGFLVHMLPISEAFFVLLIIYLSDNPLLGLLYLFSTIVFNAIMLKPSISGLWSLLILVGSAGAFSLNSNAGKLDIWAAATLFIGLLCAVGLGQVVAVFLDTIAREQDEKKRSLEIASARYDVLLNSIGDGMIILDKEGFIQFVNRQALDMLKARREDLLSNPFEAVVTIQNRRDQVRLLKGDNPVNKVLESGDRLVSNQTSKTTFEILKSDSSIIPVNLSISPVKLLGMVDGLVILFSDSSDYEEVEKAKSEFVSLASHQLRTPLNVVSWYAEKLLSKKKGDLNDKQQDYVNEIYENNHRMIALVSDLLNVSRVDLGRRRRKHQEVNFTDLIKDLMKEIRPLVEDKKINFSSSLPADSVIFKDGDYSMMTVIVQNILSNALKYTPQDGKITLLLTAVHKNKMLNDDSKLTAKEDGFVLSIKDSGIGVPKQQRLKVFGRLFRGDNVHKLDVEGTGLGLYVTQSFVNMLGGHIWFDSVENKGSTFYVYLPKQEPR